MPSAVLKVGLASPAHKKNIEGNFTSFWISIIQNHTIVRK